MAENTSTTYKLPSKNVQVFPYGTDRITDPYGRVLNEQNIRRLVRSIVDNDSYVISYDYETHRLEFMLSGYYFNTNIGNIINDYYKNIEDIEDYIPNLYAHIDLCVVESKENPGNRYTYLNGGDDENDKFTGVWFEQHATDPTSGIFLKLFDSNGGIPKTSRHKFNELLYEVEVINCGSATDLTD